MKRSRNVATSNMDFRVGGDKVEKETLFCYLRSVRWMVKVEYIVNNNAG